MQAVKAPRKQLDSKPAHRKGWIPRVKSAHEIARIAIRARRQSAALIIDTKSFHGLVREILADKDIHFDSHAITVLQEAIELQVSKLFEEANVCATFGDRATVFPKDIQLAARVFAQRK